MGNEHASAMLADLQAAMDPAAWAEIVAEYEAPSRVGSMGVDGGVCDRCGVVVPQVAWLKHVNWHYEQTITIRAAIWLAMKAPVALAHLAKVLEETADG